MKFVSRYKPGYYTAKVIDSLCSERDALQTANEDLSSKLCLYELENARLADELAAAQRSPGITPDEPRSETLRLRCRNAWLEAELEKTKRELETVQKAHDWLLEAHLRTINAYLGLEQEQPVNE